MEGSARPPSHLVRESQRYASTRRRPPPLSFGSMTARAVDHTTGSGDRLRCAPHAPHAPHAIAFSSGRTPSPSRPGQTTVVTLRFRGAPATPSAFPRGLTRSPARHAPRRRGSEGRATRAHSLPSRRDVPATRADPSPYHTRIRSLHNSERPPLRKDASHEDSLPSRREVTAAQVLSSPARRFVMTCQMRSRSLRSLCSPRRRGCRNRTGLRSTAAKLDRSTALGRRATRRSSASATRRAWPTRARLRSRRPRAR